MLDATGPIRPDATVIEIGCSSGYLLEDLRARYPSARLAGFDINALGLQTAHTALPTALLGLADVLQIPIASATADVVVSTNVLEHVRDDEAALIEILRVLCPGGRAALVVPAGRGIYDYYDRFLRHERRYGRRELPERARRAGFHVISETFLGTLLYPPFWILKKYHRLRYASLTGPPLPKKSPRYCHHQELPFG